MSQNNGEDKKGLARGGKSGLSRRKLLVGGAAVGTALPILHGLIPHEGIHHALEGASASESEHGSSMGSDDMADVHGGSFGPGFEGPDVDHGSNGFDPSEIVREFDYGTTRRMPTGRALREA